MSMNQAIKDVITAFVQSGENRQFVKDTLGLLDGVPGDQGPEGPEGPRGAPGTDATEIFKTGTPGAFLTGDGSWVTLPQAASTLSTDHIAEGSHLYYTNTRVDARLSMFFDEKIAPFVEEKIESYEEKSAKSRTGSTVIHGGGLPLGGKSGQLLVRTDEGRSGLAAWLDPSSALTGFTPHSVIFANASGQLTGDPSQISWNASLGGGTFQVPDIFYLDSARAYFYPGVQGHFGGTGGTTTGILSTAIVEVVSIDPAGTRSRSVAFLSPRSNTTANDGSLIWWGDSGPGRSEGVNDYGAIFVGSNPASASPTSGLVQYRVGGTSSNMGTSDSVFLEATGDGSASSRTVTLYGGNFSRMRFSSAGITLLNAGIGTPVVLIANSSGIIGSTNVLPPALGGTGNTDTGFTTNAVIYYDGTKLTNDATGFSWDSSTKSLDISGATGTFTAQRLITGRNGTNISRIGYIGTGSHEYSSINHLFYCNTGPGVEDPAYFIQGSSGSVFHQFYGGTQIRLRIDSTGVLLQNYGIGGNTVLTTNSSGLIAASSSLPVALGGTGATSQTTNGVMYYNGSAITSNANLTYNGGGSLNLTTSGTVAGLLISTTAGSGTSSATVVLNRGHAGASTFAQTYFTTGGVNNFSIGLRPSSTNFVVRDEASGVDRLTLTTGGNTILSGTNIDLNSVTTTLTSSSIILAGSTVQLAAAGFSVFRANDNYLYLRSGSDTNHGLSWFGSTKSFASTQPDGPVLFGYTSSTLGTTQGGQQILVQADYRGNVAFFGSASALGGGSNAFETAEVSTVPTGLPAAGKVWSWWSTSGWGHFQFQTDTGSLRTVRGAHGYGNSTLVAGTVTVANTTVVAATRVRVFRRTLGAAPGILTWTVIAGTSFTINSNSVTDNGVVDWYLETN